MVLKLIRLARSVGRLTGEKYLARFNVCSRCGKFGHHAKDRLTSIPILTLPKVMDGFVVYCDASQVGLDYVLMHHSMFIAALRQLKVHERNYLTHDLEIAMVIIVLKILVSLSLWDAC